MYYECKSCNLLIEEEDVGTATDSSEAWGHIVTDEWNVCPVCGEAVKEFFGTEVDEDDRRIYKPYFRKSNAMVLR